MDEIRIVVLESATQEQLLVEALRLTAEGTFTLAVPDYERAQALIATLGLQHLSPDQP